MGDKKSRVVGIDLGTTNSCISTMIDGKVVVIPSSSKKNTVPSVVYLADDNKIIVGDNARLALSENSDRVIYSVKRKMGTSSLLKFGNKRVTPQFVSSLILKALKKQAEDYLGEEVVDAVITVPAYFNDSQKQATFDAGLLAGLNVLRIINEPTASSLAYDLDSDIEEKTIAVYDFGGGTFDVSVITIDDSFNEVLASGGDNHLGGDDLDNHFVKICTQELFEKGISVDEKMRLRLRDAVEQAKKDLSSNSEATIKVQAIYGENENIVDFEKKITIEEFNEEIKPFVEKSLKIFEMTIKGYDIDEIVLVGGTTRIPFIRESLKKYGVPVNFEINPDECVSVGACKHAEKIKNSIGNQLTDILPISLGIKDIHGRMQFFANRGMLIPTTEVCRKITNPIPYQEELTFDIYQGESELVENNTFLGTFKITGFEPVGKGKLEGKFFSQIDENGIVRLRAEVDGQIVFHVLENSSKMSKEDILKALNEANSFDFVMEEKSLTSDLEKELVELIEKSEKEVDEIMNNLKSNSDVSDDDIRQEIQEAKDYLKTPEKTIADIKSVTKALKASVKFFKVDVRG